MAKKYETTAKELAFKAYCDGVKGKDTRYEEIDEKEMFHLKQRFELWWSEHYGERYHSNHSVFINLKRFIEAE